MTIKIRAKNPGKGKKNNSFKQGKEWRLKRRSIKLQVESKI